MMSKHTPGPWHFRVDPIHQGQYFIRVQSYGFAPLATVRGDKRSTLKDSEANARLIAAAPDLLEALKMAVSALERSDYIQMDGDSFDVVDEARAVIAKAEAA